jgi:hypothetical protein
MGGSYGFKALHFENQEPQMSVLLTLSVKISFIAPGLRPQTPTEAPPIILLASMLYLGMG